MQIREIVLYGLKGEKRTLSLRLGEVNIITGASSTGKSALIEIVDYCLGRNEFMVPVGVIRDKVAWFGLLLQFNDERIFIARQNPQFTNSTNQSYLDRGTNIKSPDTFPAQANTTIEALEDLLTSKIGIGQNLHVPPKGQTRKPLVAKIRHALAYCFQAQSEIANRDILFHRQYNSFVQQSIKDTMPFFLGAINEERLILEAELTTFRRELKKIEQALQQEEDVKGNVLDRSFSLITEACDAGILPKVKTPDMISDRISLLEKTKNIDQLEIAHDNTESSIKIRNLQDEIMQLEESFVSKADSIKAAKTFIQDATGLGFEMKEQKIRLESIELFDTEDQKNNVCPFCNKKDSASFPSAKAINDSLKKIKSDLENINRERPKLNDYIKGLERDRVEVDTLLKEKRIVLESLIVGNEIASKFRDQNILRSRILGRISLWLESVNITNADSQLKEKQRIFDMKVEALEKELNIKEKAEKLDSILNRIGVRMTELSNALDLEHGKNPVRFDYRQFDVVVDAKNKPISLRKMGSGQNWIGCHLITCLSFHQHFCEEKLPVPRFLFLDQPTQVYYPPDKDVNSGSIDNLKGNDKVAVTNMFNLIFNTVKSLSPDMQIILTDHADINDSEFQSRVVEKWRNGKALIPKEW